VSCGGGSVTVDPIVAIMSKPRYVEANSQWSMVVTDAATGSVLYSIAPDVLSYTGSVRKLFSVGTALDAIGPGHQFETPVYESGTVSAGGTLTGNLIVVASGDLTFGGRLKTDGTVDFTEFDHNEARAFGGAMLTPEDPLTAINALASQVRAAGITAIDGDVVIDDRLFDSFRVPNGNVLISPILINENVIDVTLTPGASAGMQAALDWRPKTSAATIGGSGTTTAPGAQADIMVSGDSLGDATLSCVATPNCSGTVSTEESLSTPATIPVGYVSPLVGNGLFVSILRIDDPASFARTALIDALARDGVTVSASAVAANDRSKLPAMGSYAASSQVASFTSPPYSEIAKLILKVSLNTGANLSLMVQGLQQGAHTVTDALAVERATLVGTFGLDPSGFDFPTNGSGSPDSRATARTTAAFLAAMSGHSVYSVYRAALPVMGVDGSLTEIGQNVDGNTHISAKTGATVTGGQMVAMTMAGYIDAKSGRRLTFALFVNNAGPLTALTDTLDVYDDEAQILGIVYDRF
jgi:D-alanyl-D-alanine carboxypeptidase